MPKAHLHNDKLHFFRPLSVIESEVLYKILVLAGIDMNTLYAARVLRSQ